MPHLLDQLKQETSARRSAAAREYVALLTRADNPRPGDREAMEDVMGVLGIDGERTAADLRALSRANSIRGQIVSDAGLADMKREWMEGMEAARVELRRLIGEMVKDLDYFDMGRLFEVVLVASGGVADGQRLPVNHSSDVCRPCHGAEMNYRAALQTNEQLRREFNELVAAHPLALYGAKLEPVPAGETFHGATRGPTVNAQVGTAGRRR